MRTRFFDSPFVPYSDIPAPTTFPFTVPIGFRGPVATFDLAFEPSAPPGHLASEQDAFEQDAAFLASLPFGPIASGASDYQIHPFIAPLDTASTQLTAAEVIAGLRAKNFQSEHI